MMGYNVECTPEHKFMVLKKDGPKWVMAKNIKNDDLLCMKGNLRIFANNDDISDIVLSERGDWTPPSKINEELAYIIGLYIAEGSFSDNQLDIYNVDKEVVNRLANNSLGLKFKNYPKNQQVCLCNKRFIELLKAIGFSTDDKCDTKTIPNRLLRCSEPIIKSMLSGMFDGDGHSSRHNGIVGYTSTSLKLINQTRMLLLNIGIRTKLSIDNRKVSKFNKNGKIYTSRKKVTYQAICPTSDSDKFYKEIEFSIVRKRLKAKALKDSRDMIYGIASKFRSLYYKYGAGSLGYNKIRPYIKSESQFCVAKTASHKISSWSEYDRDEDYKFIHDRLEEFDQDMYWLPVTKITKSRSPVCEISVDSDSHSYIANGFVTHNSQIAKTVILAHIKKETRDKKNSNPYSSHLNEKHKNKRCSEAMDKFVTEAREVFGYNKEYMKIIDAVESLSAEDRPHDGFIGRLAKKTKMSKAKISTFIKMLRLRSHGFSGSGVNEGSRTMYIRHSKVHNDNDNEDDE